MGEYKHTEKDLKIIKKASSAYGDFLTALGYD